MVKQTRTIIDLTSFSRKSQSSLKKFTMLQENLKIPFLSLTSANEWICQHRADTLDDTIYKISLQETIAKLESEINTENATIRDLQKLSTGFREQIDDDTSPLDQIATTEKNIVGIREKLGKMNSDDLRIDLDRILRKLEEIEGDVQNKR